MRKLLNKSSLKILCRIAKKIKTLTNIRKKCYNLIQKPSKN